MEERTARLARNPEPNRRQEGLFLNCAREYSRFWWAFEFPDMSLAEEEEEPYFWEAAVEFWMTRG